jgi:Ca-activated chloride channel homolog
VPARNLVFLVDVSGSMHSADKLPLLERGLALLVHQLRRQDHIAIVVYAGASGLALPSTPGSEQGRVLAALERLEAGGSTNGADGIELAYDVAQRHFVRAGVNRVVLATDGDFNVGVTSEGELTRLIERKRESGVYLTVLGFGTGNLKDSTMELLADKGNGNYAYIDSLAEAHKVLVREAGSTLVTVAKDVKLQVEWNPRRVASYRLIGYENRLLADRDFNDDKKDAGEMGAGHTVTALYEIELAAGTGATGAAPAGVDPLRYQTGRVPTAAAESDELLTVKVRYKRPDAAHSQLLTQAVADAGQSLEQSSEDLRWAAAVAGFGMLLREAKERGALTYPLVRSLARSAVGRDPSGDRNELLELIDRASSLQPAAVAARP